MLSKSVKKKIEERFFRKVIKTESCWNWCASKSNGYGQFYFNKKSLLAHRASLIISGTEIPSGMHVDHICRNRSCVNPAHLRIVTPEVNATENSLSESAINKAKTHCNNGHEFNDKNTYNQIKKNGKIQRSCRVCRVSFDRLCLFCGLKSKGYRGKSFCNLSCAAKYNNKKRGIK